MTAPSPTVCKTCETCGKALEMQRGEAAQKYARRRFCDLACRYERVHAFAPISGARLWELYWGPESGYPSLRALAQRLEISPSVLRRALTRHGYQIRGQKTQQRLCIRAGTFQPTPPPPHPPKDTSHLQTPAFRAAQRERMKAARLWEQATQIRRAQAQIACCCAWCAAPLIRLRHKVAAYANQCCNHTCAGRLSGQRRWHPDEPRPLFVARLAAHLKGRRPLRENLEDLAAEIGATEDEVVEALLEASE